VLQAFFQGKLKIKGNTALAMKLKDLKMPEGGMPAVPSAPSAGSGSQGSSQGSSGAGSEFKVAPVFDLIKAELAKVSC